MQRHHLRTLAALYAHPLQHGVRVSKVEALLRALGAEVSELDGRRLKIVMPGGQETWIRLGCGIQSPDLDSEAMLRVRHLLQEAGLQPSIPSPMQLPPGAIRAIGWFCISTTTTPMFCSWRAMGSSMRCSSPMVAGPATNPSPIVTIGTRLASGRRLTLNI